MKYPNKELLESLRKEYPNGCRVELVQMDDAQAPPPGTKGTVKHVDEKLLQAEKDYKVFLRKKKEQKQFVNALLSVKDVSVLTAELVKVLIAEMVLNEDRCMEIKYRFRHGDNLNYTDSFVALGKIRRDAGRRRKNG